MPGEVHTMPFDVSYVKNSCDVPQALIDRINERKCILFLGAGASLGSCDKNGESLPAWWQMVEELLNLLHRVAPQRSEITDEMNDLMEHGELLALSEWLDFALPKHNFAEYLRNRLATADGSTVHEILSKKPFAGVITTNYDNLAERYWAKYGWQPFVVTPHVNPTDMGQALDCLTNPVGKLIPIIKPHGTWEQPDSIVFGPLAYRQIMFNNEPFRNFMKRILSEFTILFVGLSFKDPNLQSLLQWVRTVTNGKTPLHYATMENRGEIFKRYFKEHFGIRLLTYPVYKRRDHSECNEIYNKLPTVTIA
ncbi:MAG: SIR2 family protein [Pseudomonadota bacterium]